MAKINRILSDDHRKSPMVINYQKKTFSKTFPLNVLNIVLKELTHWE